MDDVTVQTEQVPKPNPPRLPSAEDSLALRIKYERMKRGWSTEELARRMGEAGAPLNQSAIWRIENATPRRKISLDEAIGFAKVFDLDLRDLVGSQLARAISEQILNLVARMRDTSEELRMLRRQLFRAIAAAATIDVTRESTEEGWSAAEQAAIEKAATELVEQLVREFPWLEEAGRGGD